MYYFLRGLLSVCVAVMITACGDSVSKTDGGEPPTPVASWSGANTCSGVYPSYWQDPDPKFAEQWAHQEITNQPPKDWGGRVFKISDNYQLAASAMDGDVDSQLWRDDKFDAMFKTDDLAERRQLADEYAWALMQYIQAGNIDTSSGADTNMDWDLCENKVRPWVHIPYQTYSVMTGRDFTHGLTREAPVNFVMKDSTGADKELSGAVWAVGFFNPASASVFADIWKPDGTPDIPTRDISFPEGAVIGKLLFSTLPVEYMPMTQNLPQWQANTSGDGFCGCEPSDGNKSCTMAEQSEQCPRSLDNSPVTLLQFDVAVKDSRAPGTQWVFATFVADSRKNDAIAWNRISPLGVMWGNDPMPDGELASGYPENPRKNGFQENAIIWDTVDMLNMNGGSNPRKWPGHLGCNARLNGPADKAYSTCMSCHMTASVADADNSVPPLAAQFGSITVKELNKETSVKVTNECALEDADGNWIDAGGGKAEERNGISFAEMDSVYFRNIDASSPFNPMTYNKKNVYPGKPNYNGDRDQWISLDFSLQLSISIVQWNQWQAHQQAHLNGFETALVDRIHHAKPPRR